MTYDEYNDILKVYPDSLLDKMKVEYFLDNFEQISIENLEAIINGGTEPMK